MSVEGFLRFRRRYEVAFALAVITLFGVTNATSRIMENIRDQQPEPSWVAWLMEGSSALSLLLLLPVLLWFVSRLDLTRENLLWRVLWHIPAVVVFCAAHVGLFSLFRYWGMSLGGQRYFIDDPLWFELLYEFRKDVVTYTFVVLGLSAYRFIYTRLQGEASFVAEQPPKEARYSEQFLVKMLQREYLVRVEDILWIEAARNYVLLHCADRSYPMRQSLTRTIDELDPTRFTRVHRSAIINTQKIESLPTGTQARYLAVGHGQQVPISQTYLPELKRRLQSN